MALVSGVFIHSTVFSGHLDPQCGYEPSNACKCRGVAPCVVSTDTLDLKWRYVQTALRFLVGLVRRDVPTSADLAKLFMELCTNPQPSIRATAQRYGMLS